MPAYAKNLLPWSVVSRPLEGEAPTIDLAVSYSKANASPVLKLFLSRVDALIDRVSRKFADPVDESGGNGITPDRCAEADSPVEKAGFEPSVPLRPVSKAGALLEKAS
jgi:hypothetical protein